MYKLSIPNKNLPYENYYEFFTSDFFKTGREYVLSYLKDPQNNHPLIRINIPDNEFNWKEDISIHTYEIDIRTLMYNIIVEMMRDFPEKDKFFRICELAVYGKGVNPQIPTPPDLVENFYDLGRLYGHPNKQ